ncbi:MAG: Cys-tRNA(Pro) deacylase [Oscillospiraceae bacterium]
MKTQKTIVEKLLDKNKIPHNSYEYENNGFMDGVTVAKIINKPVSQVFKTLVCKGTDGNCVFVLPVAQELDLKKAAKVSAQKSVEMINVKDILPTTGYIKGGCSPIAMKKLFPTYIDESAKDFEMIIFSAGKIGKQVEVPLDELIKLTKAKLASISKEEKC